MPKRKKRKAKQSVVECRREIEENLKNAIEHLQDALPELPYVPFSGQEVINLLRFSNEIEGQAWLVSDMIANVCDHVEERS